MVSKVKRKQIAQLPKIGQDDCNETMESPGCDGVGFGSRDGGYGSG